MKNPDDPSNDEIEAIADEATDLSKLSRHEFRAHLQRRLDRLRNERREWSDKLAEYDPSSEAFEGLMKCLDQAASQYRETEAQLARLPDRQTGITKITIENFKGISSPVEIPLRPITLLFGANSAG